MEAIMEQSGKFKEIIKLISTMRSEIQIQEYIRENIPNELMEDDEFVKKLIDANPLVKGALSNLNIDIEKEKIIEEIRKVGLKAVIEDNEKLKIIPKEFKEQLYELAKEYEDEEEFEKAKKIYGRIIELGPGQIGRFNTRFKRNEENRETVYYKSKYSYYRCKVQNGEELTDEDKEELSKLAKEDKDNVLKLRKPGEMTSYDLFESLFEDIPEETLRTEILPYIPSGNTREPGEPSDRTGTKEYIEELSPVNRLKFIKENWEVINCKKGKGKFTGYIIFSIKDSEVVIVEKFFDEKGRKGNKQLVPSKDASTFIVHKDADIDLEKSGRSQLVEKRKSESEKELPLIDKGYHRGIKYYNRLVKKFVTIEENGQKRKALNVDLEQKQVRAEEERTDIPEYIQGDVENQNIENVGGSINEETLGEDVVVEEKTDIIAGQENSEEQNLNNVTNSNNEETHDDEKEDISVDVDKLTHYTLEDLIVVAQQLDSEYQTLITELQKREQEIQSIQNDIELISENLRSGMQENLANFKAIEAIRKGLEIREKGKKALAEAKKLKEKILNEVNKNREIRDRITNEFDARLKGEE